MKKSFDIYQRTFEFAVATIKLCRKISKEENEFIVTKQLYRSSSSVGANTREAKNAESKKDFTHKLAIAQKECGESIYWFEIMKEIFTSNQTEIDKMIKESNEIHLILSTIIVNTKRGMITSK
jgi:four helix bundle protein